MQKKFFMVLTMLLALPAFANATWYLNAKSAVTAQGTISPSGTVSLTAANSAEYTVTPTAGYKVSRVTLDGVNMTANGNGKYVAPAPATLTGWRYMVAYFATNTINITTSFTGSGAVYEDTYESLTNIPAGQNRQILIIPNAGYQIASFNGADGTVTDYGVGGKLVSFTSLQADKTVSATFSLTPVFNVSAGNNVSLDAPGIGYKKTLLGSATSNQGAITYAWTGPTDLKFIAPNTNASVDAYSDKAGVYTATLTATSGGVPKTSTVTVTVLDGKAANLNLCISCHNMNTPTIVADYTAGAHGTASGHTTGVCQRCHATDGAIVGFDKGFTGGYTDVVGNAAVTAAIWTPNQPVVSAAGVACIVCHTHDGLRPVNTYVAGAKVAWDPNGNGKVDQYDVCTGCHTLTDNTGALVGNYHDGSVVDLGRTISDTHFNAATATMSVAGYVVRKGGDTPCADCHNLHSASVEIQDQWAESGHAGKIKANKDAAILAAAATYYDAPAGTDVMTVIRPTSTRTYYADYMRTTTASPAAGTVLTQPAPVVARGTGVDSAEAFAHYNWDQTTGTGNRATCEKCHTATGAANYMDSPATYNPANNDFSHLAGWTAATGSTQNEVLYCWGCHKSATTGELRNPGAVVADYKFKAAAAVYPNVDASNVCLTCHIGQASGTTITDLTAASTNFANTSFVNSHYMAAGALMYVKGGYTNFVAPQTQVAGTTGTGIISYGQSLTSDADMTVDVTGATVIGKVTSTHRKLGTAAIIGDHGVTAADTALTSGGPCVTCHYAGGDHTLELGDANYNDVCIKCHTTEGVTPLTAANYKSAFVEPQAEVFEDALALALKVLKDNYNISYNQALYPYFYDDSKVAGSAVKDWTRATFLATQSKAALSAADAEKLMGACFNINILKREPAAFAHARTYARRLVYDTLDFLDDITINQSVGATALASGMLRGGNPIYTKGTAAFNAAAGAITTVADGTSESMTYLLGWSRTTGAWNAYERP